MVVSGRGNLSGQTGANLGTVFSPHRSAKAIMAPVMLAIGAAAAANTAFLLWLPDLVDQGLGERVAASHRSLRYSADCPSASLSKGRALCVKLLAFSSRNQARSLLDPCSHPAGRTRRSAAMHLGLVGG